MAKNRTDRYLRVERSMDKYLGSFMVWFLSRLGPCFSLNGDGSRKKPSRILLIKLHGIGNVIMMLSSMRLLKTAYPHARIDLLTFESNKEIAEGMEEIAEILPLKREGLPGAIWSLLKAIPRLRAHSYDIVIDFEQFAYISSLLAFASGAPRRLGFNNPTHRRHLLHTDPVPYRETEHMSGIFLKLTEAAAGSGHGSPDRMLSIGPHHEKEARSFLQNSGLGSRPSLVLLHPGSSPNFTSRQWPLENFAQLADRIAAKYGFSVIVTGSGEEAQLADKLLDMMGMPGKSAAGKLSIMGLAALCRMSAYVVSNDTLLTHLASAAGTPVVGLYGPNTPFLYGPGPEDYHTIIYKQLPCSPCLANVNRKVSDCRAPKCMEAITVDEVFDSIEKKYPQIREWQHTEEPLRISAAGDRTSLSVVK